MTCKFFETIDARWKAGKCVCVGLDSDWSKMPGCIPRFNGYPDIARFNRDIVNATKNIVLAYKLNIAFYSGVHRKEAQEALEETVVHIRRYAPGVPIILDSKRGDIGNTNIGYVDEAFLAYDADAVTVNPYLGQEALRPFLDQANKGIIVLCRTSNKGAGEFQDLKVEVSDEAFAEISQSFLVHSESNKSVPRHMPLYQYVAWRARVWNRNHRNVGLVVGATYPKGLGEVREIVGDLLPILVPGVGTQGGDVHKVLHNGLNSKGGGLIINSSSGIIFASNGSDFVEAARRETEKLTRQILAAQPMPAPIT